MYVVCKFFEQLNQAKEDKEKEKNQRDNINEDEYQQ